MASIRNQILDMIEAQLNEATGRPTGLTVEQGRLRDLEKKNLPHTNLYPGEDDVAPREKNQPQSVIRWFEAILEHRVLATGGTKFHKALDPLVVWGVKKVTKDEFFGGLSWKVGESKTTYEGSEDGGVFSLAVQRFTIYYTTQYGNLEATS